MRIAMPWPKDHKSKTREKIVSSAAAAFRAEGIPGVSVDDVMSNAGLTHGAFYAHFDSKDDLVSAAIDHSSAETVARFSKALDALPPGDRFAGAIDAYLSPLHAAHPEVGCPVATLGPEVARTEGKAHRELARGIRRRLEWLRSLLPKPLQRRSKARDDELMGTLACMIGGLILARAVGPDESDAVLESTRRFLARARAAQDR
jgi:TetR/AcrR family transcriptional repressor of nem operon